ncbi:MAG: hypothetical protein JWM16_3847 [Verrucomicrobiales bacterium]|nr:hypothetical protein [Verrucomicrobiales bacterium]
MITVVSMLCIVSVVTCKLVWLPDVIFNRLITLDDCRRPDIGLIVLQEYWNHSDFYTVRFIHFRPDGMNMLYILDGDSPKIWFAKIKAWPLVRELTFHGDGKLIGTYQWDVGRLVMPNGVAIQGTPFLRGRDDINPVTGPFRPGSFGGNRPPVGGP